MASQNRDKRAPETIVKKLAEIKLEETEEDFSRSERSKIFNVYMSMMISFYWEDKHYAPSGLFFRDVTHFQE